MYEKQIVYYETMDYDKFKFLRYNRTAGTNKQLKRSIDLVDLTRWQPIMVTPDYYIIDGQNRFLYCKERNMPIYYTIYHGDAERAMIALNTALKPWRQEEWLEYYIGKNNPTYIKFNELHKRFGLGISNSILLFSFGSSNAKGFKSGKLNDNSELFVQVASFIKSISVPEDVRRYRPFVNAVMLFFDKYGNDEKKIMKLEKKIPATTKYSRVDDYLMLFENYVR